MNKNSDGEVDLSIIITAHAEGIELHKTIRNVREGAEFVRSEGKACEIILHVDNGSDDTIQYIKRFLSTSPNTVRVIYNEFGDLGLSRNAAIKEARGKYVANIDAGDLVSPGYFIEGLKKLKSSTKSIVLHPEYCLSFYNDERYSLWRMLPLKGSQTDIGCAFLDCNRYISAAFGLREVFLSHPYIVAKDGYGYEDYAFNVQTTSDGIAHDVVKDSVYFYRKEETSMLAQQKGSSVTIPYVSLFDFSNIKRHRSANDADSGAITVSNRFKNAYIRIRDNKVGNAILTPIANAAKAITGKQLVGKHWVEIPPCVLQEWKNISHIETGIYPTKKRLSRTDEYRPQGNHEISNAYIKLSKQATHDNADYIIIAPWLISGGADKVIINYAKSILKNNPDVKITIITTLKKNNIWRNKLPKGVDLLEFGNYVENLSDVNKNKLFTTLIVQLRPKAVHIVNSRYGYEWAGYHKALVKGNFRLDASLFCYDVLRGTNCRGRIDYADPFCDSIDDVVSNIFTDNSVNKQRIVKDFGFDPTKIHVLHQPVEVTSDNRFDVRRKNKVLWASRLCAQKNPSILDEIARKMPEVQFDIYGRAERGYEPDKIFTASNIKYRGGFNDINKLPIEDYDAFVYTSLIDGMPNIVLEIAACGLPIVTSNAGGVKDFIDDGETGLVVEDPLDVEGYVKAIKRLLNDDKLRERLSEKAYDKVSQDYSWSQFYGESKKLL